MQIFIIYRYCICMLVEWGGGGGVFFQDGFQVAVYKSKKLCTGNLLAKVYNIYKSKNYISCLQYPLLLWQIISKHTWMLYTITFKIYEISEVLKWVYQQMKMKWLWQDFTQISSFWKKIVWGRIDGTCSKQN